MPVQALVEAKKAACKYHTDTTLPTWQSWCAEAGVMMRIVSIELEMTMKTPVLMTLALASSVLLSGCFSSMYVINRVQNGALPETTRDLNTWASLNPLARQSASLIVQFDDSVPNLQQALPARLEYSADNCGFKGRSVEGLLEAHYPRGQLNIAAQQTAARTYQYRFYQDAFLPKQDEHGRTCVWKLHSAELGFKASSTGSTTPASFEFLWFAQGASRDKVERKYFASQPNQGRYAELSPENAQNGQAFGIAIQYQP